MSSPSETRSSRGLFLEGVVIVVSILLAFSLEAWWDARGERQEEILVLGNLLEEFRGAAEELDLYLSHDYRIERAVALTLERVRDGRRSERATVAVPDTSLALIYIPPTFNPQLGTLDGLLGSGRLGILGDSELRSALAGWPGVLEEAAEEDRGSLDHVRNHLDPVLWAHMDVSAFRGLAAELYKDEPDSRKLTGSSQVPVNNAVIGVLAARHQILWHQIEDLEELRREIDRIVGLLERAAPGA